MSEDVIAPDTQDQMGRVRRQARNLIPHIFGTVSVYRQKRGLPVRRQYAPELGDDVGAPVGVGPVIQDRVAQQHYMCHAESRSYAALPSLAAFQSVSAVTTMLTAANPRKRLRPRRSRAKPRTQGTAGSRTPSILSTVP